MNLRKRLEEFATGTPRRTLVSSIVIILLLPLTLWAASQRWELRKGAGPSALVFVEPTPLALDAVWETGTVEVRLEGVTELSAFDVEFSYDSSKVQVEGVEFPNSLGGAKLGPEIDIDAGLVSFGAYTQDREEDDDFVNILGDPLLATVSLKAIGLGSAPLTFTWISVSSTEAEANEVPPSIDVESEAGLVQIGDVSDPTPTPTEIPVCDYTNCTGCCDEFDTCYNFEDQSINRCGSTGNSCMACPSGMRCVENNGGGVCMSAWPTPTPEPGVTPTITPTPTSTPTPTPTSTPTPTPTPAPGCWDICILDGFLLGCPPGLECQWVGLMRRCVNPNCESEGQRESGCICPVPTPTPAPTPTITPTPTPGGEGVTLGLVKVAFGHQNPALGRGHRGLVSLYFKRDDGTVFGETAVQLDQDGKARNVGLLDVVPGTYDAFIYEPGYLIKKLAGASIEDGSELDFTKGGTEYFLVGDFNGDQEVNIFDVSIFIDNYGLRGGE